MTLSQHPRAILMRKLRARRKAETAMKPRGKPVDYARHAALVTAYEAVAKRRFGNLDILAHDLGYAHRDSLLKAYKRAVAALSAEQARWPGMGRAAA